MYRLKQQYENKLEELVIQKPELAEWRESLIAALESVCVPKDYASEEPSTMADIDIREYGHLTRVNDTVAAFFYQLHCEIKPTFMVPVESDTVQKVLENLKQNQELFQTLQRAFPTLLDTSKQRGLCMFCHSILNTKSVLHFITMSKKEIMLYLSKDSFLKFSQLESNNNNELRQ